jgi:hypothetical protein
MLDMLQQPGMTLSLLRPIWRIEQSWSNTGSFVTLSTEATAM